MWVDLFSICDLSFLLRKFENRKHRDYFRGKLEYNNLSPYTNTYNFIRMNCFKMSKINNLLKYKFTKTK